MLALLSSCFLVVASFLSSASPSLRLAGLLAVPGWPPRQSLNTSRSGRRPGRRISFPRLGSASRHAKPARSSK